VTTSVTGDTGWVRPGGRRTIVWDAKAEYPTAVWGSCRARIRADDSSGGVYPGQMVYIPAGSFLMGNSGTGNDAINGHSDEFPQHSVYLSGYWIGKYEVTRGEYRQFMQAGGYANPAFWSTDGWTWKGSRTEPRYWAPQQDWGTGTFTQTDNHPVVGVSYYESEAFCNWAGGHLATEAQWEKAARWTGSHPNVYPWGDVWDAEKCKSPCDSLYPGWQTAPVGSYPSGASPYDCQDMAGNAWEWCQDWAKSYPGNANPFDYADRYRVVRGGGFWYFDGDCGVSRYRCAFRYYGDSPGYDGGYGFRIAR